ncbi:MAG TPA: AzlD domain-containing protein [Candidatus Limnocylindrales bacterium]|jgi:branched-subunit amino acid transport protein
MPELLLLALLMGAVTYPSRAIPLLVAGFGRLPAPALAYLRLVGPAVLAALAAVYTMVVVTTAADGTRTASFHIGIEWVAVLAALALVIWRKSLLLGIVAAAAIVALARATGAA